MVDGSSYNFLFYEDGVFSDTNCGCDETSLNHAMLLVGYVAYEESQQSYWILKNRSSRVHSIGGVGTYSCAGGASCARRRSARVLNAPRNLLYNHREIESFSNCFLFHSHAAGECHGEQTATCCYREARTCVA